jgi:hypothetical protein
MVDPRGHAQGETPVGINDGHRARDVGAGVGPVPRRANVAVVAYILPVGDDLAAGSSGNGQEVLEPVVRGRSKARAIEPVPWE